MLVDFLSSNLVDFLFSSQRRNTDSLQHKGLKWAADDLLCKCAKVQKVQKGQKMQKKKSAKCRISYSIV